RRVSSDLLCSGKLYNQRFFLHIDDLRTEHIRDRDNTRPKRRICLDLYKNKLSVNRFLIIEKLNLQYIFQLPNLLFDLRENPLIPACHNRDPCKTRIRCHTCRNAVNTEPSSAEKSCNTA